jgi:hypothetical protein
MNERIWPSEHDSSFTISWRFYVSALIAEWSISLNESRYQCLDRSFLSLVLRIGEHNNE